MECKQALELITASLDGEIESSQHTNLHHHLTACLRCRNEFELERMTKTVVRRQLTRAKTPAHLASRISAQLAQEANAVRAPKAPSLPFFLTVPVRKTFFALGGAVAIIVLAFTMLPSSQRHLHIVPNDGNIIHQTYSSFDGLLNGSLVPQISSDDPTAVKAFFTQKVNFNVDVPHLKSCKLCGGTFSHYSNQNVAQIIYKYGNDIVYLYEAQLDSVLKDGGALNLPDEAKQEIKRTGWYVENHTPNCTLMVWKSDSTTLCCAVAEMSKDRLLACLREAN